MSQRLVVRQQAKVFRDFQEYLYVEASAYIQRTLFRLGLRYVREDGGDDWSFHSNHRIVRKVGLLGRNINIATIVIMPGYEAPKSLGYNEHLHILLHQPQYLAQIQTLTRGFEQNFGLRATIGY